jgi:EAL domain-containing protein (putative c-di-GMP-specific phosphodiesterase class I)/GGDEF domain-containing protein
MLYSESKERHARFISALKIGAPFLGLIIIYIGVFQIFEIEDNNFILFLLFILVYIYYIFYVIYSGFEQTLIDEHTDSFNAHTITKYISSFVSKSRNKGFVALMRVRNIDYISEQYGVSVRDHLLKKFVEKLNNYLVNQGYKNIPIGRYQAGHFLIIFDTSVGKKQLLHELNGFCKELERDGIFKIEVDADAAVLDKNYDDNAKNIIAKLYDIIAGSENDLQDILKPSELDILVRNAVNAGSFEFSYHAVRSYNDMKIDPKIYSINTKLFIDRFGTLPYSQLSSIVKKNGYEIRFDQMMISTLFNEIKLITAKYPDLIFMIKISAVSFRNRGFLLFLKELMKEMNIDPANICFTLNEKKIYDEFERFRDIIAEYRVLGFMSALEQFGAGSIGSEYLKHGVIFDIVSFDIEYIKHIDDKNYFEMLRALGALAKNFRIKTLIKFIDKEHMLYVLKNVKPDFVQGFLLDKPKHIKDF